MEPKKTQPKAEGNKSTPPAADGMIADKVRELEEQVKKLTDIAGRAQADLQNAKMRLEKSAEDMRKYAAESLLLRLLPTIDNFQRAFQHLPEDLRENDWVKGVTAIEQELMRQLTEMGLKKVDALHQPLDPSRHEVLLQGEGEEGKVIEVLQEGYELHGRVLRPAKVKVGAKKEG
ncbi:MAG: nucleotide exchange factor GrpE [Candidatus Peribacteraceae bacterium]|jgi:molecular chaperone GrpE